MPVSNRQVGKFIILGTTVLMFLLLQAGDMSAQTENEFVDDVIANIKSEKFEEAIDILETAHKKHPQSLKIAKLRAGVFEKLEFSAEMLADAYNKLLEILCPAEIDPKKLTSREELLLKSTRKKLTKLLIIRIEVDSVIKEFVSKGITICENLCKKKKYIEASFIFQRLTISTKDNELRNELKSLAEKLKDKANLLKRPAISAGKESVEANRLVDEAQKLLKRRKFDEARLKSNAALEIDPNLPEAVALLCSIAEKEKKISEMLKYGLTYLLYSPKLQTAKRVADIEKCTSKATGELKHFFDTTKNAADQIYKHLAKAMREKRNADVEYVVKRLSRITHKTKKVETILAKARSHLGGVKIFNGEDLSGWSLTERAKVHRGCLVVESQPGDEEIRIVHTGMKTSGSFSIQFSFMLKTKELDKKPNAPPTVFLTFWEDGKQDTVEDIFLAFASYDTHVNINLLKRLSINVDPEWKALDGRTLGSAVLNLRQWYKLRIEYNHKTGNINLIFNDKAKATVTMPKDIAIERTGYIGIGQQFYKSIKLKNVYLEP